MGDPKSKGAKKNVPAKKTKKSDLEKKEVAATIVEAQVVDIIEEQKTEDQIITDVLLGESPASDLGEVIIVGADTAALEAKLAREVEVKNTLQFDLTKSLEASESLAIQLSELAEQTESFKSELSKAQADPEYLVVIPYLAEEAQGNEIELAIRGWDKHFKEKFTLVIVGDYPSPQIMKNLECLSPESNERIIHIGHECITNNPPLDIIAKLQLVIETLPHFDRLILTNDDIYPINDFDITEVKLLKSDGLLTTAKKVGELYAKNRAKTLAMLEKEKLSVYDYGSHTPVYLDSEKFLELIEKFNLTEEAYLLTSLYFNTFYPQRIPLSLDMDTDNLKVPVGRPNANLTKLKQEFMSRKIWISNPTAGWSKELAEIVAKRLG